MKEKKILVAFYSRKGNNYVSGNIVKLSVGNTEIAARKIQKLTNGDLFKIDTIKRYPEDYTQTTSMAQKELNQNARPELTDHVMNMAEYDVIILGYPNWWGTMPMAVYTFLNEYDFAGKTLVPFCTHEGSGLGNSERDIKRECPVSTLMKGLSIKGSDVDDSEDDISAWLKKLGIID